MQITTWEEAWSLLNLGGVYICEDMATSMVCRGLQACQAYAKHSMLQTSNAQDALQPYCWVSSSRC